MKKEYLDILIAQGEGNDIYPRKFIFALLFKIFFCFKKTVLEEYKDTKNELKKVFFKILKMKNNNSKIRKIYITFSDVQIKMYLKNKKFYYKNHFEYRLKNADLDPQDIIWENINISKIEKIIRRILSMFLLFVFILVYFLIILIISRKQNTFQMKYNMLTDCKNIDIKNNHLIYNEFINIGKEEKGKIFTYCYCESNLNGNNIAYNNTIFDPCQKYNKYKYNRKIFIYILSAFLSILDIFVDPIVNFLISLQRFESKSFMNNLTLIISTIIILFTNIILIVLINARFKVEKVSFFIFGRYEDITPQWMQEMPEIIITNGYFIVLILFLKNIFDFFKKKCIIMRFIVNERILHFYEYFKVYTSEKDYNQMLSHFFFFFYFNILIFSPFHCAAILIILIVYITYDSKRYINNYILNKQYFKISLIFIKIGLIFNIIMKFWFFNSEYYFINIGKDMYSQFYGGNKNKDLIDKLIKGEANISEKIKAKFLIKQNYFFIIQMSGYILFEIMFLFTNRRKKNLQPIELINRKANKIDEYSKIKLYEMYRLLNIKLEDLYLSKNINENNNLYSSFLRNKFYQYITDILEQDNFPNNFHDLIMQKKKSLIENKLIIFNNPDYTYSPFLLDDYSIPFIGKFILSPYYT